MPYTLFKLRDPFFQRPVLLANFINPRAPAT